MSSPVPTEPPETPARTAPDALESTEGVQEGADTGEGVSEAQGATDDEDYGDERHQLAMVIHDGGCQCRGHTLGWTIRARDSLQLADAVLAGGYVRAQPDDAQLLAVARAIRDVYEELPDGSAPGLTEPHEWLAEARAALVVLRGGSETGGGHATT